MLIWIGFLTLFIILQELMISAILSRMEKAEDIIRNFVLLENRVIDLENKEKK